MSELKGNKNFPRATPKTINSQNFIIRPKSILLYALTYRYMEWDKLYKPTFPETSSPGTGRVLFLSTDGKLALYFQL